MIHREGHLPLQPASGSPGAAEPALDPAGSEAQWREAARSLGLDEAPQPLLEPEAKAAIARQVQALIEAQDHGVRHFVDHQPASESPVADLIRRYPIKSRNVVAHIRKATVGQVALENCHPFVRELWGRYWVFAHNGTLENFHPRLHGHFRPVGQTDSERAFCWLMQELAKSHASLPRVDELTLTLRELAPQLAKRGPFNFLLSNGQALWAHCSTNLYYLERKHPFAHAQLADEDLSIDFARHTTPADRVAVVVTAPLTTNEQWTRMAPGELRVLVDGVSAG